jgi:predicted DNA-binding protein (MmcQ/YjbR family)
MTPAGLRKICLSLPGAREEFPFRPELSVYKVGRKMFALSARNETPLRVSVKCDPELGEQLRATYPAITSPDDPEITAPFSAPPITPLPGSCVSGRSG